MPNRTNLRNIGPNLTHFDVPRLVRGIQGSHDVPRSLDSADAANKSRHVETGRRRVRILSLISAIRPRPNLCCDIIERAEQYAADKTTLKYLPYLIVPTENHRGHNDHKLQFFYK